MNKNKYKAPTMCMLKMEPQRMLDNSVYVTGIVTKPGEEKPVNDQSEFGWGGYNDDEGYVSDAKKGDYNPWTAWDNLPAWE